MSAGAPEVGTRWAHPSSRIEHVVLRVMRPRHPGAVPFVELSEAGLHRTVALKDWCAVGYLPVEEA